MKLPKFIKYPNYIYFCIGFLLAAAMYSVLFHNTIARDPMVGDDSLAGVLKQNPNFIEAFNDQEFVLSKLSPLRLSEKNLFKEKLYGMQRDSGIPKKVFFLNDHRIQVQLQDRQSALPQYVYSHLPLSDDPVTAQTRYQMALSLFMILLFGIFIYQLAGLQISVFAMLLLSMDALELVSYGPVVCEQWMKILTVTCLILGIRENVKFRFAAGILVGLGMTMQITYLWHALLAGTVLLLFLLKRGDNLKKNAIYFMFGLFCGALPAMLLMDWPYLLQEVANFGLSNADGVLLKQYPLRDFIYLFTNKAAMLGGIMESNHLLENLNWGLQSFSITPAGVVAIFCFFIWTIPFKNLSATQISTQRWCRNFCVGTLIFFFSCWIFVPNIILPTQYLIGLNWVVLSVLVLGTSLLAQKQRLFLMLIVFFSQASLNYDWIMEYRAKGPIPILNANLQKDVTRHLLERSSSRLFAISYGDMGTYEYLSKEKLQPIHATLLTEEDDSFPDLVSVLRFLKAGSMVITLRDELSSWYHLWGPIQPDSIKEQAHKSGIKIDNEYFGTIRGKPEVWVFSFAEL